jgi:hypothetical protein
MIYLYWWIAIGVVTLIVVLGSHLLTKKKESDSLRDLLDAANPERTKFSYRLLNNIVAPALGPVLIVVAWPVAVYMKAKELFPGRNGGVGDSEREFAVESKHLQARLSVHEIEQREVVADPLKAVPGIPFGHLHQAWANFLADLPEGAEVWSLSAQWENRWGQKELREGYVSVEKGIPDRFFLTIKKDIEDDTP